MSSPLLNSTAPLPIRFVIVGGGISGLSAAYTLCKAGHEVRVLEKAPGLGYPSSGIRVPPNMSKILKKWVGKEELDKLAVLNVASPCIDINSGVCIGVTPWEPTVMAETGGEFLMMKHEDVHRLVYRLAISAGAEVNFGVSVANVSPGSPTPCVTLSSGETIDTDVVIGADGRSSIVRPVVCDFEDNEDPCPTGTTVYSGVVAAEQLKGDPKLEHFIKSDEWAIGFGTGMTICCFPVSAKSELAFALFLPDECADPSLSQSETPESWYNSVPTSSIQPEGLALYLRRLMLKAPTLCRSQWLQRDQAEEWVDESGRIVLLGEAAHPFPPGTTYATAAGLEDAVVLGTLFSHLSSTNQITTLLNAYQEIRETRCRILAHTDTSNASLMMLPPGPARDARDRILSAPKNEWDEDSATRKEFDGLAELFGYEAEDAAMQWWVDWGRYIHDRSPTRTVSASPSLSVEKLSLSSPEC
ncbi:FAD/NAD(P)-binding domain-containing protein [Irpex rosettiformis]|uniref:FAD/NAD(P)-binding domain-containing protein n=1 Tax=Irpex rosettiformis TaxID=378272 RepID=A0ACB8U8H7_9APHY|nr:FAD/NAD(P)-binding domain-containing protein [Irpex rosettiformis]